MDEKSSWNTISQQQSIEALLFYNSDREVVEFRKKRSQILSISIPGVVGYLANTGQWAWAIVWCHVTSARNSLESRSVSFVVEGLKEQRWTRATARTISWYDVSSLALHLITCWGHVSCLHRREDPGGRTRARMKKMFATWRTRTKLKERCRRIFPAYNFHKCTKEDLRQLQLTMKRLSSGNKEMKDAELIMKKKIREKKRWFLKELQGKVQMNPWLRSYLVLK